MSRALRHPNTVATQRPCRDAVLPIEQGVLPMPIPDERLPQIDESDDLDSAVRPEMLDEEDELEFESSEADTVDDDDIDNDETGEPDTVGFGYGDPAD